MCLFTSGENTAGRPVWSHRVIAVGRSCHTSRLLSGRKCQADDVQFRRQCMPQPATHQGWVSRRPDCKHKQTSVITAFGVCLAASFSQVNGQAELSTDVEAHFPKFPPLRIALAQCFSNLSHSSFKVFRGFYSAHTKGLSGYGITPTQKGVRGPSTGNFFKYGGKMVGFEAILRLENSF